MVFLRHSVRSEGKLPGEKKKELEHEKQRFHVCETLEIEEYDNQVLRIKLQ